MNKRTKIYNNVNRENVTIATDSFTCEAHQGTQHLKKAILFTLKQIK